MYPKGKNRPQRQPGKIPSSLVKPWSIIFYAVFTEAAGPATGVFVSPVLRENGWWLHHQHQQRRRRAGISSCHTQGRTATQQRRGRRNGRKNTRSARARIIQPSKPAEDVSDLNLVCNSGDLIKKSRQHDGILMTPP